jgi:hypothetical protein
MGGDTVINDEQIRAWKEKTMEYFKMHPDSSVFLIPM